jgi:hypothetical protein
VQPVGEFVDRREQHRRGGVDAVHERLELILHQVLVSSHQAAEDELWGDREGCHA